MKRIIITILLISLLMPSLDVSSSKRLVRVNKVMNEQIEVNIGELTTSTICLYNGVISEIRAILSLLTLTYEINISLISVNIPVDPETHEANLTNIVFDHSVQGFDKWGESFMVERPNISAGINLIEDGNGFCHLPMNRTSTYVDSDKIITDKNKILSSVVVQLSNLNLRISNGQHLTSGSVTWIFYGVDKPKTSELITSHSNDTQVSNTTTLESNREKSNDSLLNFLWFDAIAVALICLVVSSKFRRLTTKLIDR